MMLVTLTLIALNLDGVLHLSWTACLAPMWLPTLLQGLAWAVRRRPE